jgi:hypothetical protein
VIEERQEITIRPSVVGWILILMHLGLGFVTIALAVDEKFADGKVTFATERWRVALGLAGLFLTYRAARAVVRTISRAAIELGPHQRRNARIHGAVVLLIAAGFLAAAWNEDLANRSVEFMSWTKPVYIAGGILLLLTGLVQSLNPRPIPQQTDDRGGSPNTPPYR